MKSSHEEMKMSEQENIKLNVVSAGLANQSGYEVGTAQPLLVFCFACIDVCVCVLNQLL